MVMFDIAEWIVNLFLLGTTVIIWCLGLFMFLMLIELSKKFLKELLRSDNA